MDYLELIIVGILTSILAISLWQFSTVKKEMRIQIQQQTYAKIIEARLNLEKTETFTKMAKESPVFANVFPWWIMLTSITQRSHFLIYLNFCIS